MSLDQIKRFLGGATPQRWLDSALKNIDILLIDHAHCEKKAASSALSMIYRYPEYEPLLQKMSRLAREELRHFEQVLKLMTKRGIQYCHLSPARYASGLREHVRKQEPYQLIDSLIIGAFIEARSCERFAALVPYLDEEIAQFYHGLLNSEARHYQVYLKIAEQFSQEDISERVAFFRGIEVELINSPDEQFRFHSGVPE